VVEKIDLKKELKYLYSPSSKKVDVVEVPKFNFVMIDGQLEPGEPPAQSSVFQEAMGALFGLSYTLKFMSKLRKQNPIDYTVMAVEGLWWVGSGLFNLSSKEPWCWTLMMMQPAHITGEMYAAALAQVRAKRDSPALDLVRFESFHEGLCIQTMHMGPYADEPATLNRMEAFASRNGYRYQGRHHEIYLGDPRRSKPEKLRTILRHPIEIGL